MFLIAKSVALHHSRSTWRILPGNLRVTQSACYMHSLLEFNKLRCIQHGHRLLLLSLQTQMSYTRQIRKEKAATPLLCIRKRVRVHTQASPCALFADDDGIIKSYIPLFYYKGAESVSEAAPAVEAAVPPTLLLLMNFSSLKLIACDVSTF